MLIKKNIHFDDMVEINICVYGAIKCVELRYNGSFHNICIRIAFSEVIVNQEIINNYKMYSLSKYILLIYWFISSENAIRIHTDLIKIIQNILLSLLIR